ncbi:MAG: GNAT family N-acetyltransferase [Candidatus Binatia bacterium]
MITGSCLCRGIRFEIRGRLGSAAQCHCEDCRKAQGSSFAANATVARANFAFICGQDLLASYESSPGKYRTFCFRCGSPIFSRRDDDPATVRVRLGTLDGDPGVRPSVHGWIRDKAPWERLPEDGLPRFATGSPDSVMPRLKLRAEDPASPDARMLIGALDEDLAGTYPREVIFGLHEDDHDDARMVFLVGRIREKAVACGALRSLDRETGEVKRMYVVPELRGTGISRRLLAAIETVAIGRRHQVLRLETGRLSPAPLALYRTSGYREISPYGEYAGNDYSVCFEKKIP